MFWSGFRIWTAFAVHDLQVESDLHIHCVFILDRLCSVLDGVLTFDGQVGKHSGIAAIEDAVRLDRIEVARNNYTPIEVCDVPVSSATLVRSHPSCAWTVAAFGVSTSRADRHADGQSH
jgi:hypothetical protein